MTTTRQRVNLTLTEMEQRLLEAILTDGTTEHEIFADYLDRLGTAENLRPRAIADVVHVLLKLGIERLEEEAAEISYAAEAAATTNAHRAVVAELRDRHMASAARENG
ncbi:MAG TPA: hypothetical protein VMC03_04380 [Streptosporangiaceae bacterium]|nr:hypothetical protein [Streptosporangiaceae bacterium]